ncbi:MAG: oligosaccharide flippase family protein [Nibricoccus sp.]
MSPVYSRLYTPGDYGVFSVYTSIVATVLTVGSLSYEQGIPIAKEDSEAVGLTVLSFVVVLLIGLGALAWLGAGALLGSGETGFQLGSYRWLVPVGIVGAGGYRAINYWALRRKAMVGIARTSIWQCVGSNVLNLGFGVFSPSPLGLILAGIAGNSTGVAGLAKQTQFIHNLKASRQQDKMGWGRLWTLAVRYRRLALVQAPSTLLNSLGIYLPGMLALPYFGSAYAGQLFMALKVIALPGSLLGGSLSQVFLSGAATVVRERPRELKQFFDRVFMRGALCSIPIILMGIAAPWLMPLAFGRNWEEAGVIVFWFSIYETVGLSVSALSSIPNVVGRHRGQFIINCSRAVAVFLLFFCSHRLGLTGIGVVKGYTLVMVLNYVACYFLYRHQVTRVSRTGTTGWGKP